MEGKPYSSEDKLRCSECKVKYKHRSSLTRHVEYSRQITSSGKVVMLCASKVTETISEISVEHATNVSSNAYEGEPPVKMQRLPEQLQKLYKCSPESKERRKRPLNFSDEDQRIWDAESDDDEQEQQTDTELSDEQIWPNVTEDMLFEDLFVDTSAASETEYECLMGENDSSEKLAKWYSVFMKNWQSAFNISDAATDKVLNFFKTFLSVIAKTVPPVEPVSASLPGSRYMLHKVLNIDSDPFEKHVVCPKCFTLYTFEECHETIEGVQCSKVCWHVPFPHHKLPQHRKKCGEKLLISVTLSSGRQILYPKKVYCRTPLKQALGEFVKRPEFEKNCEKWRQRKVDNDIMTDVYDGRIWANFNGGEDGNFLQSERNYAMMLNVDWFQPFTHVSYSVGAIYGIFFNLPREQRLREENVILLGVIPHMGKEPPTNSFIEPIVREFLQGWEDGFDLVSYSSPLVPVNFKVALLCIGCDIPACRKLCGFLSHNAKMGCSRCKKEFPGRVGEQRDFGGFEECTPRTHSEHVRQCKEILIARTKEQRKQLEKQYGTRYSVLIRLPYLDLVNMSIVDGMHNWFMGTAKHLLWMWKTKELLNEKQFVQLQEKIDSAICPAEMGRLPHKVASGFAGFTADQLKTWTTIFSVVCLKDILSHEQLECWRKFVLVMSLLCRKAVRKSSLNMARQLMLDFCCEFEEVYGREFVTPNMHLHLHSIDCVEDYGPPHVTWLFGFERFNGVLGDMNTNNRSVEMQLMRRFQQNLSVHNLQFTLPQLEPEVQIEFENLLTSLTSTRIQRGTLGQLAAGITADAVRLTTDVIAGMNWNHISAYHYNETSKLLPLSELDMNCLQKTYDAMYPDNISFKVAPSFRKLSSVKFSGRTLGSKNSQSSRSSQIIATWSFDDGEIDTAADNSEQRAKPGIVEYYLLHNYHDKVNNFHIFAKVKWLLPIRDARIAEYFGAPISVWEDDLFIDSGPSTFIPVQRIKAQFVSLPFTIRKKPVKVVMPRSLL